MRRQTPAGPNTPPSRKGSAGVLDKALALTDKLPGWLRARARSLLLKPYARSASLFRTRRADAFILSFPKCGRTWLRVLLSRYIIDLKGLAQGDLLDTFELTC